MKSLPIYLNTLNKLEYGFISILGISFWFFLGFPFANHNESYLWIVQLNQSGLLDVLKKGLRPVANFRPLGIITAWLGYRLSGGSIYPQQIFNYLVASLAWLILFSVIKEKKLFGLVSFIVGGAFFSGYIYLFHLHGVFYSPLLVFIALLLAKALDNNIKTKWLIIISVLAAVTSLYHPFSLPIYIAFMFGYFLENLHITAMRKQLITGSFFVLMAFGIMRVLVPNRGLFQATYTIPGFLMSYKLAELNPVLSIISWLLSVVTVFTLDTSWQSKVTLCGIVSVLSLIFIRLNQPVLIIWIIVCLLKTALMRKWSLAFLIMITTLLPAATASGAPTHTIFVLIICSAVVPLGCFFLEKDSIIYHGIALILLLLVSSVIVLLKSDVHLPVISALVKPILAEKEKTYQMEDIIKWLMASDYNGYRIMLSQSAKNPVASTNVIKRTHRAPTSQNYLDAYIDSLHVRKKNNDGQLLVCFGGEKIDNAQKEYVLAGQYNGEAIVYHQPK